VHSIGSHECFRAASKDSQLACLGLPDQWHCSVATLLK
jgi:hypothetical protein